MPRGNKSFGFICSICLYSKIIIDINHYNGTTHSIYSLVMFVQPRNQLLFSKLPFAVCSILGGVFLAILGSTKENDEGMKTSKASLHFANTLTSIVVDTPIEVVRNTPHNNYPYLCQIMAITRLMELFIPLRLKGDVYQMVNLGSISAEYNSHYTHPHYIPLFRYMWMYTFMHIYICAN